MAAAISYQTFRIDVQPYLETNDHEVRFFGDGDDVIARFWGDSMGLDPADILRESSQLRVGLIPHKALIARCTCGCLGCGDIVVHIQRAGDRIQWLEICRKSDLPMRTFAAGIGADSVATEIDNGSERIGRVVQFDAGQYDEEVERALRDTDWETPERTAARLVCAALNHHMLASGGFKFLWASGRARLGTFTIALSLEPGPYQILIPIPWNDETAEEIVGRSVKALNESPSLWTNAEWWPQRAELEPPGIAGPTWRRGG